MMAVRRGLPVGIDGDKVFKYKAKESHLTNGLSSISCPHRLFELWL